MRGESLTQTVGIHSQIEIGQPNQTCRRTKIEQEAEYVNKRREPHPNTPQTMPRSRQRDPLQQTSSIQQPRIRHDLEEGRNTTEQHQLERRGSRARRQPPSNQNARAKW